MNKAIIGPRVKIFLTLMAGLFPCCDLTLSGIEGCLVFSLGLSPSE